jgi:hypothetical protein
MIKNIFACAIILLGGAVQACSLGCTEIGCFDQLSGTIKTEDGAWSDGTYVITITVDQISHECSMQLPEDFPKDGTNLVIPCEPELTSWTGLVLEQDTVCTSVFTDNAMGQSCEPIAGKYALKFSLDGTPDEVAIKVKRDGVVLVSEDFTPAYEKNRPNGRGCGPVCQHGTVEVEVP